MACLTTSGPEASRATFHANSRPIKPSKLSTWKVGTPLRWPGVVLMSWGELPVSLSSSSICFSQLACRNTKSETMCFRIFIGALGRTPGTEGVGRVVAEAQVLRGPIRATA